MTCKLLSLRGMPSFLLSCVCEVRIRIAEYESALRSLAAVLEVIKEFLLLACLPSWLSICASLVLSCLWQMVSLWVCSSVRGPGLVLHFSLYDSWQLGGQECERIH